MDITNCTARKFLIVSLLIFSVCRVYAQKEDINTGIYHPAKEHFEQKYVKQSHAKFAKSQITIDSNKVMLGFLKIIEFPVNSSFKARIILENGFLDPTVITGRPFLKINDISELPLLNPNYKTKRFSFLVYKEKAALTGNNALDALQSSVNPDIFFFELQNQNATKDTTFKDFVEGAVLTYFGYGGIIL